MFSTNSSHPGTISVKPKRCKLFQFPVFLCLIFVAVFPLNWMNCRSRDKLPVLDHFCLRHATFWVAILSKEYITNIYRISKPSRPSRLTNPRLLANPSHRHKRLLIYCRFRYFLIFPLLTYCCPHYIFFAQDGRRKGGVSEAKVIQNRPLIRVGRYGHFRTEWTLSLIHI